MVSALKLNGEGKEVGIIPLPSLSRLSFSKDRLGYPFFTQTDINNSEVLELLPVEFRVAAESPRVEVWIRERD